jgi:hypothetical protein
MCPFGWPGWPGSLGTFIEEIRFLGALGHGLIFNAISLVAIGGWILILLQIKLEIPCHANY